MKKIFTAKHLSLMLLLSLMGGAIQADRSCDNDSCARSCYECGCNPLYCGSFGLQVQGGVYPIVWTKRGDLYTNNCTSTSLGASSLVNVGQLPKFSNFFKTPWTVGGQVSYAMSDNTNIFVEFNYAQANGKGTSGSFSAASASSGVVGVVNPNLAIRLNKYKLFNAYFGARYYFDRWCDRVSFFIGEKIGLVHHKSNNFTQLTAATVIAQYTNQSFFNSNTVVSGGVNLGFDICFCGNWSVVITGEVVASCGPRNTQNIVLGAADAAAVTGLTAQNLLLGNVNTELSFPVTLGVKYNF